MESEEDVIPVPSRLVAVGSVAPDFTLTTTAGDKLSLATCLGKGSVVLVFLRGLF